MSTVSFDNYQLVSQSKQTNIVYLSLSYLDARESYKLVCLFVCC